MDPNMKWMTLPSPMITVDSCSYSGYITRIAVDRTIFGMLAVDKVTARTGEPVNKVIHDKLPDDEHAYLYVHVWPKGRDVRVDFATVDGALRNVIVSDEAYLGPIAIVDGQICSMLTIFLPIFTPPPIVQRTLYVRGIPVQSKVGPLWFIDFWFLDRSSIVSPEHIKKLVDQAIPVDPSGKLYYVGPYFNVGSPNDLNATQAMDVYIMFASDLQEVYETANALQGLNNELIVIDPKSYQDYISGKSSSFDAISIHVQKQFVDITVPKDASSVYISDGSIQIIEDTKTIGNYDVTTYKAIVTSPQYQLDLSDVYGIPFTIDVPQSTTIIDFPRCAFITRNWVDESSVDSDFPMPDSSIPDSSTLDSLTSDLSDLSDLSDSISGLTPGFSAPNITIPNITIPDLEAPQLPSMYTYTIDVIRSLLNSYIWRCEQYADFLVVVHRSDGLRLSSSSYKIVSVATSPSLEYTITKLSDSYTVRIKLPQQDTTVHVAIAVEIDGKTYTHNWSFTVTEWGNRRLSGAVKTDRLYYDYGSPKPAEVTVTVRDINGKPMNGLTITDNWNNTYTDHGDGTYKATIDISNLPTGQYNVFVKIDPGSYCYKSNLSDQFVIDKFVYNPLDSQNQDFKLTYPLVENVTVTVNGNETSNYSITLNEYGEGILHIGDTLNEGDRIEVKYQAYMSSTIFYVGSSEPISSTVTNEESIAQYGQTPAVVITIPFLHSREEANEIAEMYLKYYSKPTKIISTNNKW